MFVFYIKKKKGFKKSNGLLGGCRMGKAHVEFGTNFRVRDYCSFDNALGFGTAPFVRLRVLPRSSS